MILACSLRRIFQLYDLYSLLPFNSERKWFGPVSHWLAFGSLSKDVPSACQWQLIFVSSAVTFEIET